MSVKAQTVVAGKCCVTKGKQVRRVLTVAGTDVTYESRGKKMVVGSWGSQTTVNRDKFAADVDHIVPCDYDPDYAS
jgi:hypothetical protein